MKRLTMSISTVLIFAALAFLSACSSGGGISLTFPGGKTLAIDQGQSIVITAQTKNDAGMGVAFTCSGAACTALGNATIIVAGNVTSTTVTFSATGATGSAVITGTSIKQSSLTGQVTITVNALPSVSTTQAQVTAAAATAGIAYSFTLTAAGGSGALTWAATGLSDGLSLNTSTGAISGTPTAKGSVTFSVTVTDSSAAGPKTSASVSLTITVNNPPAPAITTTQANVTSAPATAASAYAFTFHATGTGTLTWSAVGLPADGLSLNASTGVVSGTPTSKAVVSFTLTVSDTFGQSSSATAFTITVNNPPAPTITTVQSSVPNGTVGTAYSFKFIAAGTGTLTWSAVGLPADGLSLNASTGVVSGTPTTKQAVPFTLTVSDTFGQSSAATSFTITVNNPAPPVISTTPAQVPSATVNVLYGFTLQGSGYGTLTWSTTPALSDNLSLNANTGAISGTPTTATTLTFSVTLTDGLGQQTTVTGFSIIVSTESVAFTSAPPSSLTAGATQSVSATVSSDAGNGGVNWTVTCGGGPCGSFTATHTASGVATTYDAPAAPPTGGTVTITATAVDAPSPLVSAVVTINAQPLVFTTSSLPTGTVNTSYNATITASGGVPPYTFSLDASSTALPANLTFNPGSPSATITGTPTSTGTTNGIVVDVKDSEGTPMTAQMTFSITINSTAAACNSGNESFLKGQYAFLLQGFDTNGPVELIGSFTADGAGKITAGEEDLSNSTTGNTPPALSIIAASSTYSVGLDASGGYRGCMTIATSAATSKYRFVLNRIGENTANVAGNGRMVEFDSTGTLATGVMRQQTAAAFSNTQVTGNYAFGFSSTQSSTAQLRFAVAGTFTASGTTLSSGTLDTDDSGNVNNGSGAGSPMTFTGTRGSPDSNGRTTISLTPSGSSSSVDIVSYIVSATELLAMNDDTQASNGAFAGMILQQSARPFTTSSVTGTSVIYATGLSGGTPTTANTIVGLVKFTSPNNYAFTADQNGQGTVSSQSDSGTYSVAPNGRMTITSSGGGGGNNPTFYLVSPGKGFLVGTDNSVTAGSFEPQSSGSFSTGSASGVFGFGVVWPAEPNVDYQEGWANFNGSGTITGMADDNSLSGGLDANGTFSQDYAVASNGRGTVYAAGLSSTPSSIFYIVSSTKAIVMKAYSNSGTQVSTDPTITVGEK